MYALPNNVIKITFKKQKKKKRKNYRQVHLSRFLSQSQPTNYINIFYYFFNVKFETELLNNLLISTHAHTAYYIHALT